MTGKGIDDMKLRYYLRGVGTGILVTAIIMGIALGGQNNSMTEEQIKEKAKELGMVEESLLSEVAEDVQDEQKNKSEETQELKEVQETNEALETNEAQETEEVQVTKEVQDTQEEIQPDEETMKEETIEELPIQEETAAPVMIEVVGGESSVSISKKLEAAGLITSAKEYDQYLCNQGYDKKIIVGKHEVPIDADYETIAKIITSK